MTTKSGTALIVGAGIGGIALSIRLAHKGFSVKVFDSADKPGGKLNEFNLGPYRFDLGPSLFTLPELVIDLFRLTGRNPEKYFSYRPVDIACRYFWDDGTIINAYTNQDLFFKEIREKLGVEEDRLRNYLRHTSRLYDTTAPVFLQNPIDFSIFQRKDLLKATAYFPSMDIFRTMNDANRKRLGNEKLVQIFNRMATYNGSSPYLAPGILNVISSLEHVKGVYFPSGGMYGITSSLVKLAKELKVEFKMNEEVLEILHQKKYVTGVRTNKEEYFSELVISNSDIVPTYRRLLRGIKAPELILNRERSSSALVFYWGINKSFPELDLHNIFFSRNYPVEFDFLFKRLELFDDPTVYINISSRMNPADAPESHENWFVMINAPHNNNQDWDSMIKKSRMNILKKLSGILSKNISSHIITEEILDPRKIESLTSSYKGSLYGTSSNDRMAAFLRHGNKSRRLKGLYFTGGSVHPGGGIPLCLLSAKITAELVERD